MLTVRVQKISPTHHTLEYEREDGSSEKKEFESKSLLMHDFIHFALESEAHLKNGFFGLLDQGYSYDELSNKEPSDFPKEEGMEVEMVVGPFTGIVKESVAVADLIHFLERIFEAHGKQLPLWITRQLLERAHKRYKRVVGEWNSLEFGETLELVFE